MKTPIEQWFLLCAWCEIKHVLSDGEFMQHPLKPIHFCYSCSKNSAMQHSVREGNRMRVKTYKAYTDNFHGGDDY